MPPPNTTAIQLATIMAQPERVKEVIKEVKASLG
jgi:hypothetical protein